MPKHDLVQALNPRSNRYVLIDRAAGKIVKHKATAGPYKNIPIATRRTPDEERERTMTRLRQDMERKRDEQHFVTRDPKVRFGEPQVWGVNTAVIAASFGNGEFTVTELADEYGLSVWQVYVALAYERVIIDRTVEGVMA